MHTRWLHTYIRIHIHTRVCHSPTRKPDVSPLDGTRMHVHRSLTAARTSPKLICIISACRSQRNAWLRLRPPLGIERDIISDTRVATRSSPIHNASLRDIYLPSFACYQLPPAYSLTRINADRVQTNLRDFHASRERSKEREREFHLQRDTEWWNVIFRLVFKEFGHREGTAICRPI